MSDEQWWELWDALAESLERRCGRAYVCLRFEEADALAARARAALARRVKAGDRLRDRTWWTLTEAS